ncbi:GNAT family N-acetyltransferase [uncultured Tenacibaculum sp.]|uniref:GNAT family N-acetyltransferase n=1 Tax=uncultured Tenacibaculum sp. TaxID=174713 RepID=UPI00262262D3|nr:GNAT family N-acetyltransferase [uncultured Tenacibaculum sp.]
MNILSCSKNQNSNTKYFSSIKEVPNEVWEELGCTDNIYFTPKYLEALEQNNKTIHFAYIILFDTNNKAIALANIQIVDFYLDSVQNDMQSIVEWVKCMGRKLRIISPEKPFKVLTCGNTFVSGEHGVFIKNNQNKKEVLKQIAKAVVNYSNASAKNAADAFMLKDFEKESLYITHELHEEGYNSFKVDPNMVLELDNDWSSIEDYLAALKTKFRVKAKRALKLSSLLKVEDVTEGRLKDLKPEMTVLYKTVSTKSSFNLGDFNIETYRTLKENLGDNYFLKVYWLEDKLVGFLSGIFNRKSLDAHFVGIDYGYNKEYAVYQRMLYDYISLGIDKKVKTINFGRTASEIKSSVGAKPQDLTIYLRHKNTIPNRILSLFLKRIQPSEFKHKHPFKKKELREQVNL